MKIKSFFSNTLKKQYLTKVVKFNFGSHGHDGHGHEDHHKKVNPIQLYLNEPYHKNHYKLNAAAHHHVEEEYKPKFNPVKYVETLNKQQRIDNNQKVFLVDDAEETNPGITHNHLTNDAKNITIFEDPDKAKVMIPYSKAVNGTLDCLLDSTEIKARIYNLLRQFDYMSLEDFDFNKDYEKDLGLDSLDWTAILTSIEYEFHTAFNDTFYEHWRCLEEVVNHLKNDELAY